MKYPFAVALLFGLYLVAACVPADESLGLGSVQFTFTASERTRLGITRDETENERYDLTFERVVLGFRTMTVGKIGAPDTCSYRGRGAVTDAVFRPLGPARGLVQTFNGISPVECPDVGVIFGVPVDSTVVDANATSDDLVELARNGFHAVVDAVATRDDAPGVRTRIELRFNPITTATRFGGCRLGPTRGTFIAEGERDRADILFAAENLFRGAVSDRVPFRVRPFVLADERGNRDGIVTMAELDRLPLSIIPNGQFYQVPFSTTASNVIGRFPSLGDFVRFLFRFTLRFRSETGTCTGNEPGSE